MAFTEDEKAAIRAYLGYSDGHRDFSTELESQLAAGLSTAAETRVKADLTKLAALDTKLNSAATDNLDLRKVDEVEFLGPEQIAALQAYGRSLVQRLAIAFGVDVLADYYAASGALAGGVIPLG